MTRFPYFLIIFLLLTHLGGCSYLNRDNTSSKNLNIDPINWQEQQADCPASALTDKSCPSFKLSSISFKKIPTLNQLIETRLLEVMNAPANISLHDYLTSYLAKANQGDHLTINVDLLEESSVFIVLELSVQTTHATSQYNPKKFTVINFDKQKQQDITLAQAIHPDKTQTFWSVAQISYNQWLEANQLLNNKMFQEDWPFVETTHIALLSKQAILKYDANTLAPYAMGEPQLFISYEQLRDIIKPIYSPR